MNSRRVADVLREISPARIFARPTAEDLWLGPTRESVLRHLRSPAPLRVVQGPASSGRTTLLRHLSAAAAFRTLTLRETGRVTPWTIKKCLGRGHRIVLEVDDADRLDDEAWANVERLASTGNRHKRPELLLAITDLDDPGSPAAAYVRRQRTVTVGTLSWLEPAEVNDYVGWRLSRFDLAGLTTRAATRLIAKLSHGRFETIDQICQAAMLLVRKGASDQISIPVVYDAVRVLQKARRVERRAGHAAEKSPARKSQQVA